MTYGYILTRIRRVCNNISNKQKNVAEKYCKRLIKTLEVFDKSEYIYDQILLEHELSLLLYKAMSR